MPFNMSRSDRRYCEQDSNVVKIYSGKKWCFIPILTGEPLGSIYYLCLLKYIYKIYGILCASARAKETSKIYLNLGFYFMDNVFFILITMQF